jgi:uncharacterized repeat protein (TIGR01451 family)
MLKHLNLFRFLCLAFGIGLTAIPTGYTWDCLNAHRNQVTITAGAAGHNEEIRIDLTSSDFPLPYNFTSDGADVRVVLASDDTTPVDHIVTGWDATTRTGTVYIKLPALAANSSTSVYVYYGDDSLTSLGDVDAVFPTPGLRLRSRVSSADPTDAISARAAFAAATVNVYDAVRSSVSGQNNRSIGGTNSNYGWCISAMIEVTPATAGIWQFRYGADFGRGGHLFMREVQLEEQWNDNLWWANNYANTAETLEGSINLPAGWHRYEALGFEDCCDGPVGWQARAPGGPWQNLSTANFSMRATRCVVTTVSVSVGTPQSCSSEPVATKSLEIISDPFANTNPFALPGSVIEYTLSVTNEGQLLDADTVILTDMLPDNVKLIINGPNAFTLTDGATPSDLSFSWVSAADTGDDVGFSTDGTNFSYAPNLDGDGADTAITHVRFSPRGAMRQRVDGTTDPSFEIKFQVIVE